MRMIGRPWIATLAIGLALIALSACSNKTSDRSLVFVSPEEGMQLAAGEEKKLLGLAGATSGVWIDPRTEEAFVLGHIPGALHLPLKDVATNHEQLKGYDVIIVYGDGYHDPVATGMSKKLLQFGYKDVRTLQGGLRAWRDAGFEVETGLPER